MERVAHLSPMACFSLFTAGFVFGAALKADDPSTGRLIITAVLITLNLFVVWLDGRRVRSPNHTRSPRGFWWTPIDITDDDKDE